MDKKKVFLQFNKTSGVFVTTISGITSDSILNKEFYNYIEVEMDVNKQTVEGTYDDFKIIDKDSLPTRVYESHLNKLCHEKIIKEYPLVKQIDVMRSVLEEMITASGSTTDFTTEFDEMNSYIDEIKRRNKVIKESYKNSKGHQYISIAQQTEEYEKKLEGGIHEAIGPRPIDLS